MTLHAVTYQVIYKTLDPVWNETLTFDKLTLGELVGTRVLLRAFDYDGKLSQPDPLGELSVPLEQLRSLDKAEFSPRLSIQGSLMFSVEWVPAVERPPFASSQLVRGESSVDHYMTVTRPLSDRYMAVARPLSDRQWPLHQVRGESSVDQRRKAVTEGGSAIKMDSVDRLNGKGVLKVHLRRAVGLVSADANGKSDPYVVVAVGGKQKKSSVVQGSLEPEFNETLAFDLLDHLQMPLQELVQTEMVLSVFDKDGLISQFQIGTTSISLQKLRFEDIVDYQQPLNTQGALYFTLEWVPAAASGLLGQTSGLLGGLFGRSSSSSRPPDSISDSLPLVAMGPEEIEARNVTIVTS